MDSEAYFLLVARKALLVRLGKAFFVIILVNITSKEKVMVDGNVDRMILDLQPEECYTLIQVIMPGINISEVIEEVNEEFESQGVALTIPAVGGELPSVLEMLIVFAMEPNVRNILVIISGAIMEFLMKSGPMLIGRTIELKSKKYENPVSININIDQSININAEKNVIIGSKVVKSPNIMLNTPEDLIEMLDNIYLNDNNGR